MMRPMSGTRASAPADISAEHLIVASVSPIPERIGVGGGIAISSTGAATTLDRISSSSMSSSTGAPVAMGWGMPLPERTEGDSY